MISLNITSQVPHLLGTDKVGAWNGMFSAGINYQLYIVYFYCDGSMYLARYFPLTSVLKERRFNLI